MPTTCPHLAGAQDSGDDVAVEHQGEQEVGYSRINVHSGDHNVVQGCWATREQEQLGNFMQKMTDLTGTTEC